MQTALYIVSAVLALSGLVVLGVYAERKSRYNAVMNEGINALWSGGMRAMAEVQVRRREVKDPGWQGLVTGLILLVLGIAFFVWALLGF